MVKLLVSILRGRTPETDGRRPHIAPFHVVSLDTFEQKRGLVAKALCEVLELETEKKEYGKEGETVTPRLVQYPTAPTSLGRHEHITGRENVTGYSPPFYMDFLQEAIKRALKSENKCLVLQFSRFEMCDSVTRDIILRLINDDGVINAATWAWNHRTVEIPQTVYCLVCVESGFGASRLHEVRNDPLRLAVAVEADQWITFEKRESIFCYEDPLYVIIRDSTVRIAREPPLTPEKREEQLLTAENVLIHRTKYRTALLEKKYGKPRFEKTEEEVLKERRDAADCVALARQLIERDREIIALREELEQRDAALASIAMSRLDAALAQRHRNEEARGMQPEENGGKEEEDDDQEESQSEIEDLGGKWKEKENPEIVSKNKKEKKKQEKQGNMAEGVKEKRKRVSITETTLIGDTNGWVSKQRHDKHYSLKCRCGISIRQDSKNAISNHEKECQYHQSAVTTTAENQ